MHQGSGSMIAKAEEIGIQNAAKEFGVPWQTIAQYKRRANEKAGNAKPAEPAKAKKAGAAVKAKAEDASAKKAGGDEKAKVEDAPAKETASAAKTKPENVPAKKDGSYTPADIEALKIENAVLQDRIRQLQDRVVKLTKAVRGMIS